MPSSVILKLVLLAGSGMAAAMPAPTVAEAPPAPVTSISAQVPVVVRIRGLALGGELRLRQGSSTLTANLNDDYTFAQTALAGAALDLQVVSQPAGQVCAVSELASASVPADSSPLFVRCRYVPGPRVVVPATLPNSPLSLMFGNLALRAAAYPGLPYESRPGVVGGQFPYEFRITGFTFNGGNQNPAGLQLDFRHGTLRFTPAAEGSYVIGLEIRDSSPTPRILTQSVTVEATRSAFVFVAPGGVDAPDRGSLAQPYQSVAYALARSTPAQVLMLRKGRYLSGGFAVRDNRAKQFIAYPDEVVVMDQDYQSWINVGINDFPAARFEDLDFTQVRQYGIFSDPSRSGLIVRNVRFADGREGGLGSNENPAFIHGYGDGVHASRHRLLVQDSDFGPLQMTSNGAYAATLFDAGDSLFENNQIRVGPISGGIHDKDNSQRNTYRENYIAFAAPNPHGIHVSAQDSSEDLHIHHNLLVNAGIRLGLQCTAASCVMRNHDVHHNTLIGLRFGWGVFNSGSSGTRIAHNIFTSGSATAYSWHSCLSAVPANFATQLSIGHNLIETSNTLAMHDTECGGSPMNMNWASWRNSHGMDTVLSGSVVTTSAGLLGAGPTLGLPIGDPRRVQLGHLYLVIESNDGLFRDGFQAGQ
ncbi:parallel beta helix pectate lyase-like protein [Tahibacter aquaticus]|uniref:Parallel beta helix pectate lyase-like protein n=1 Tax=Tahibacter aquaticus TaxID=520092 RepID=A0A4V3DLG3_9GAMM|nr:right-handed parallel beta-helix repeat-containing protein [Tahibacter aquaticus]TDR39211.1 parallel beta helix pectate lyase-like protein [Tahibacter aquaticus]